MRIVSWSMFDIKCRYIWNSEGEVMVIECDDGVKIEIEKRFDFDGR